MFAYAHRKNRILPKSLFCRFGHSSPVTLAPFPSTPSSSESPLSLFYIYLLSAFYSIFLPLSPRCFSVGQACPGSLRPSYFLLFWWEGIQKKSLHTVWPSQSAMSLFFCALISKLTPLSSTLFSTATSALQIFFGLGKMELVLYFLLPNRLGCELPKALPLL